MNRRRFLQSAVVGALGAPLWSSPPPAATGGRAEIGISSWSFHNYFAVTREVKIPPPGGDMNILDFPEMVASRYGVHAIEIVAPHFASTSPEYLAELRARLRRARVRLVNIPADIDWLWEKPGLSDPDEGRREKALRAYLPWVEVARAMGAASIRCDPGIIRPEHLAPTLDSYRTLTARARSRGIRILIENHGQVAAHPEELVDVFRGVGAANFGSLPDFGNFPDNATRWRGLRELLPYASTVCHAKDRSHEHGRKVTIDLARCVRMARASGFHGMYSIEYAGDLDPHEGVARVLRELKQALA